MTEDQPDAGMRTFPAFLEKWQEVNGPDFTPTAYLNQQDGIPFVIAAGWLYAPDFVEYRGGVFRTELPRGMTSQDLRIIDDWYDHLEGDVPRVERIANTLTLFDMFVACDVTPYGDDLPQLADTIARSWRGLLCSTFPERRFKVEAFDDSQSYGPQVTFFQDNVT